MNSPADSRSPEKSDDTASPYWYAPRNHSVQFEPMKAGRSRPLIDKTRLRPLSPQDPLWRIFRGIENHTMVTDGSAVMTDNALRAAFSEFSQGIGSAEISSREQEPGRRARIAMAHAIYSQPHLAVTFKRQTVEGEPEDPAFVLQSYTLEKALGLPQWELDDIRESVDVRVGKTLKQARALQWLWTRFGLPKSNPEPMFRVLIPGAKAKLGSVGLVRRGPQLYIVVDQKAPPPIRSLFMSWLPLDHEHTFSPLETFQARYVDKTLRKSISRSLGCSDEEVILLLDGMITVIPKRGSTNFLRHDHWRSRAISAMTELAHPYTTATWLTEPLNVADVNWRSWLSAKDGALHVADPGEVFDAILLPRARAMMRQIYAQLLAQLELENVKRDDAGRVTSSAADVHLYNVATHLRQVSQPMFDWAKSDHIRADLSRLLELDRDATDAGMQQLLSAWRQHFEMVWSPSLGHELDGTVQSRITRHLVNLHTSIRRVFHRASDSVWRHQDFVVLFAAHYLANTEVEALWSENEQHTEDVDRGLGDVFWSLWQNLLAAASDETEVDEF